MAHIFNPNNLTYELNKSPLKEFSWHRSPDLSELVKSKNLEFDIKSLDPGSYSYPYHFHRNSEELIVILTGKVMLRTPEGFKLLSEGDIVFFEMGPDGTHQLYNHTAEPCRYFDLRTEVGLDICEYPDSGKINILPYKEIYQADDKVDYYKNEEKVSEKWPEEIIRNDRFL